MVKKKYLLDSAVLKGFPFFASFSDEGLEEFIKTSRVISTKTNQVIFHQSECPGVMYLIIEGGVKIEREDTSGERYALGELSAGQTFGELVLLRGEASRASAIAVRDSRLLVLDRAALLAVIRQSDSEQALSVFFALDEQTRAASERGFREILARRMLASQLEVEKQRALTQIMAGVAHEVNTPLGVIHTAVNIMARELAMAPREVSAQRAAEIAESLELMRLNVERADHLLQDFKKVSISQLTDEKSAFDIVEALNETIDLIIVNLKRSQIQVEFENQLDADKRQWVGYRGLLSQVLINLLANVERYAYPNGVGGIANVIIRLGEDEKNYCLSVRDCGRGILKEDQTRVFDPFYTTGRAIGGTGLGLSIVHNIVVNALKGDIQLTSSEGKGTEFMVTFPREILD